MQKKNAERRKLPRTIKTKKPLPASPLPHENPQKIYAHSGFWYSRSVLHTLVPVLGVRRSDFCALVPVSGGPGDILQNHPFGKHPFAKPRIISYPQPPMTAVPYSHYHSPRKHYLPGKNIFELFSDYRFTISFFESITRPRFSWKQFRKITRSGSPCTLCLGWLSVHSVSWWAIHGIGHSDA